MEKRSSFWSRNNFALFFLIFTLFLVSVSYCYIRIPYTNLFTSLLIGYGVFGAIRIITISEIMRSVWKKTKGSHEKSIEIATKELKLPQSYIQEIKKQFSATLHYKVREPFHWAPKTIGVLEGIIYTTAVIFDQLGFIAVWLGFKALGEWNDSRGSGPTRVRANNFVIGNGLSLITGIIGGIIFWYFYNSAVLIRSINDVYKIIK